MKKDIWYKVTKSFKGSPVKKGELMYLDESMDVLLISNGDPIGKETYPAILEKLACSTW